MIIQKARYIYRVPPTLCLLTTLPHSITNIQMCPIQKFSAVNLTEYICIYETEDCQSILDVTTHSEPSTSGVGMKRMHLTVTDPKVNLKNNKP